MALPLSVFGRGMLACSILGRFCDGSALGQVSFDLRTRLAFGWGDQAVAIREPLLITKPGRYDFELQEGVYDAEGFTNYGVANWIGRIHATEPALSQPANPRVAPFNNSIGRDGIVSDDQTEIGDGINGYIDAAVGPTGFEYTELPPPPPPLPHGAADYVALYRFSLTVTDLTEREIMLTAESLNITYTPISGWQVVRDIPPDPETGDPGYIEYVPIVLGQSFGQAAPNATAVIRVVPVVGSGTALGILLLIGIGRRNRDRLGYLSQYRS